MGEVKHWSEWEVGDTVIYTGDDDQELFHMDLTVGEEYTIQETPDEYQNFLILDDDGDELAILVSEVEWERSE